MTTAIVDEEDISNMEEDKEKDRERGQLMQHLIDVFLLMLYEWSLACQHFVCNISEWNGMVQYIKLKCIQKTSNHFIFWKILGPHYYALVYIFFLFACFVEYVRVTNNSVFCVMFFWQLWYIPICLMTRREVKVSEIPCMHWLYKHRIYI